MALSEFSVNAQIMKGSSLMAVPANSTAQGEHVARIMASCQGGFGAIWLRPVLFLPLQSSTAI